MNGRIILFGIALLGLPSLLPAQVRAGAGASADLRGEAREAGKSRDEGGMDAHAAVRAALAAGLPKAPVRRVIAEGKAKGAPRPEVDRAAMIASLRLRASRDALRVGESGREPSRSEILAGAEALAAGASREDLESLRDAAPAARSLVASLNALAELRLRGMDGGRAAARIAAGLAGGASDRAIVDLGAGAGVATEVGSGVGGITGALDSGASGVLRGAASGAAGLGASVTGSLRGGGQ